MLLDIFIPNYDIKTFNIRSQAELKTNLNCDEKSIKDISNILKNDCYLDLTDVGEILVSDTNIKSLKLFAMDFFLFDDEDSIFNKENLINLGNVVGDTINMLINKACLFDIHITWDGNMEIELNNKPKLTSLYNLGEKVVNNFLNENL